MSQVFGAGGTISVRNSGTLVKSGTGTFILEATLGNNSEGVLDGSGTLSLAGATLTNASTIRPAGPGAIGAFNLTGNFVQTAGGHIEIETEGAGAGQSDRFAVSGNATLAGVFELVAINGYQPSGSIAYPDLMTYGSRTGTFGSIAGASFPGLTPTYGQNGLTLAIDTGGTPPVCPTGFDICWIGAASGSWNDGTLWSTGLVPTAQDSVYISAPGSITITAANGGTVNRLVSEESFLLTGGTFALNGVSSIAQTLTIAGGTFQANGTLDAGSIALSGGTLSLGTNSIVTALNSFAWTNGNIFGSGATSVVQIAAPATLTVSGGNRGVSNLVVTNAGQMNVGLTGGSTLLINDGASVVNSGTLTFTENNIIGTNSGSGSLVNSGTIAVATDRTGTIQPTSFSNDNGTLQASASNGILQVRAGTNTYNGTTTIVGNGVRLDGGTHDFTDGASVNGTLNQSATTNFGTVALNGIWSQIAGNATIGAGDTLALNGTGNWSGDNLFGSGGSSLQVAASATLNISGGSRGLSNVALNNGGRINLGMSPGGTLLVNDAASIVNAGTLSFTETNTIGTNSGAGSFFNTDSGTLTTATNVDGAISSVAFDNDGLVLAGTDATITLQSGGSHAGAFEAATGGVVVFSGGAHNLSDGSRLANGLLQVTGGSVNLVGTGTGTIIPVGAVVTLNGQVLNGSTGKLDIQGTLNLANSVIAGSVVNSGTLNVTGSSAVNGARFDQNAGVLDLGTGATLTKNGGVFAWNGGVLGDVGTLAMVNGATFEMAGSGARVLDGPTLNVGQLRLPAGSLELRSGNLTTSGVSTIDSGSTLVLNGGAFANSAPVTVNGIVDLRAGTLTLTGDAIHGGGFVLAAGTALNVESGVQTISGGVSGVGSVSVNEATLTVDETYSAAATTVIGGTLTLTNTAQSQRMTVGSGGLLAVNGTTTVGALDMVGGTVNAAGTLNAGTLNHANGTTDVFGRLNVANLIQTEGSITGTGALNVTNSYNVTGGTMGGRWSSLGLTHRLGDLTVTRALSAQGPLTIDVPNGTLALNGVEVSSTSLAKVSAASIRIMAGESEAGIYGAGGVRVATPGDLVLQAGLGQAFITSGRGGECSVDVGRTARLIGGSGEGANAVIRGDPDVGGPAPNEMRVGQSIEFVSGTGGSARIESRSPESIFVYYPNRSSGGYTVDGQAATWAGQSGFYAINQPAVLGQNLHVRYGVGAADPIEIPLNNALVILPTDPNWPMLKASADSGGGRGGVTTERRPIRQCR